MCSMRVYGTQNYMISICLLLLFSTMILTVALPSLLETLSTYIYICACRYNDISLAINTACWCMPYVAFLQNWICSLTVDCLSVVSFSLASGLVAYFLNKALSFHAWISKSFSLFKPSHFLFPSFH